MKTYIKTTLTILMSGMLFSSCEDQLNQANPNQATEDTFWKDSFATGWTICASRRGRLRIQFQTIDATSPATRLT